MRPGPDQAADTMGGGAPGSGARCPGTGRTSRSRRDRRPEPLMVRGSAVGLPGLPALRLHRPGVHERSSPCRRRAQTSRHTVPTYAGSGGRAARASSAADRAGRPAARTEPPTSYTSLPGGRRWADRDDRPERSRCEGGEPQRGEPARPSEQPHAAVTPGLCGQPVEHLDPVGQGSRRMCGGRSAVRVAVPARVHAHGDVTVARVPRVSLPVAGGRGVGEPAGEVLEQGGDGSSVRGRHARAYRRVPSRSGIQKSS